jgi:hypothetical protein
MNTISVVTPVFMSKADALALLSETLELEWILDDPADVTLPLPHGGVLSIDVPHYGEDLPLTLEIHHPDRDVLEGIVSQFQETLSTTFGWETHTLG